MSAANATVRAIRLELIKPLDESWDVVGPLLHTLSKVTPKLLNAAMDARIAIDVAGKVPVKAAIAPDAKAASPDGLAYQAVLREIESLRAWAAKKSHPWKDLAMGGAMSSAISRAASQAFTNRNKPGRGGQVSFASERILVRGDGVKLARDERGFVLSLKLRPSGTVRFALAGSRGAHRDTLKAIVSGAIEHGDCKLQWDRDRRKWYALLSYEPPAPVPVIADPARVLAVHRGIRNVLYLMTTTGSTKPFRGGKFVAQRRQLQARMKDIRRVGAWERGGGAKGHGIARRLECHEALGDKLARATHTFCQQIAAEVARQAKAWGCGRVVIEDYGGIKPDDDPAMRRVLDRFPFSELKQSIASRLERDGLELQEVPAPYISTTCPRCNDCRPGNHNRRTGMFHCRVCIFERPADWVAAWWMLDASGADMTEWRERMRRERELAESLRDMKGAAE